ncbi:hypothetical protein [Nostoc sp. NMS4]|uniref:hypothetical protein n=1 Tax=Nostoc sp. NMS4 TaxID=2815390 RepID=UPI0025DE69D8|nr:hypothetical protein [Nostoc sp. NMS4]MBN3927745.1 hypothetical protein [Nostoc sp. NMS4]
MNVTDIKLSDIIAQIGDFNRTQATGLICLISLAVREQTTVAHQYEEIGFEDIPERIVTLCYQLNDDALLDLIGRIALALIMEKNAAALDEENAQHVAAQAIDDQEQPTLLSDY